MSYFSGSCNLSAPPIHYVLWPLDIARVLQMYQLWLGTSWSLILSIFTCVDFCSSLHLLEKEIPFVEDKSCTNQGWRQLETTLIQENDSCSVSLQVYVLYSSWYLATVTVPGMHSNLLSGPWVQLAVGYFPTHKCCDCTMGRSCRLVIIGLWKTYS